MRTSILLTALLLLISVLPARARMEEDEKLLKAQGLPTDGPGLLAYFRKQTPSAEDRTTLEKLVQQLGSRRFAERDQAMKDLRQWGRAAKPFLKRGAEEKDLEIARRAKELLEAVNSAGSSTPIATARLIALRAPTDATVSLLRYLPYAADEDIEEAVCDALVQLAAKQAKPDAALTEAIKDKQPLVRGAAAWVLGRNSDKTVRTSVLELLKDDNVQVRYRAAHALLLAKEGKAVEPLIGTLQDLPLSQTWPVEELLYRLAAEKAPAETLTKDTPEERKKWVAAWQTWWKDHGDKVDLAKAQATTEHLGLVLAVEYDTKKVWEAGPDGKTRWEIKDLDGPMDAWIVGPNRVLIAEFGRITERDFTGKILWETKANDPNGAQRLPNGNLFVSTYGSVTEFDRKGNQLYKHTIPASNGIRKARNGNILYTQGSSIVEIDTKGNKVRTIPLPNAGTWTGIEELPNGRFLVCATARGRVLEVDAKGTIIWEATVPGACGVTRMPNGHTLVAAPMRVERLDREGKKVWEMKADGHCRRVHSR